jgi:hypothetical protein
MSFTIAYPQGVFTKPKPRISNLETGGLIDHERNARLKDPESTLVLVQPGNIGLEYRTPSEIY